MATPAHAIHQPPFGHALRAVRGARKLSQLDLATAAEISQRHLSFLESGRARPSRVMVLQLAESLNLPLRERNRLLIAAGFAPIYPQRELGSPDMAPVRQALERLLAHHEPFPAVVMDRRWNILMSNRAIERLTALIGDADALWQRSCGDGPRNMLKLMLHPEGLRPLIENFEEAARVMIGHAQHEAVDDARTAQVLEEVLAYPGIPARWKRIEDHSAPLPVLSTRLRAGPLSLGLFTMLTTFGTPQDVTTEDLRVETMYPADAESEALLRKLAS